MLIRTYRMPGAERKEDQEEVLREAPVDIAEGCPARSEGPQEVATRMAAERCADEDIAFKSTGDITLLDLRGGGGPPGAGVWKWLMSESESGGEAADMHADCEEDSDIGEDPPPLDSDEESDAAEPEELQEELEGGEQEAGEETARHQADEEQSQEPRGTPMGPIITGRRGETQVMICPRCNCDVPTRALASHSCGEVSAAAADADDSGNMAATRGGQVRRLISLWEALQNGGPADGVGTLGAQGGGELPGARHEDAQQGWDASLTEWPENIWPGEGQRLPNLVEVANCAYWRETGGAYTEWEQSEGGQAPPGDQEHHAEGGGIRWRENACQECLLPFPTAGTEWRICACSSLYCAGCARGPCSSCGAAYVWREEGEQGLGERTTGSQEAERENCGRAADSQHGPTSMGARTWTPSELHKRRCIERDKAIAERRKARMQGRAERKEQRRQGKRPWRERRRQACASFMTVNATCAESLKKELTHGQDLARSDYIMCQELGLRGEKKAISETWAEKNGWDVTIDEAYIKQSRCGGGTGVLSRGKMGIRPTTPPPREIEGRLTLGVGYLDCEITVGSWYGVTGCNVKHQIEGWRHMAERVKLLRRPFVIGGDWQVLPEELEKTGLPKMMGATVVAPKAATNLRSKRKIDYFLVSKDLLQGEWEVRTVHGCNLATHAPVELKIRARRHKGEGSRLAGPRLLPAGRPIGPQLMADKVDWGNWGSIKNAMNCESYQEDTMAEVTREWYAGAECELMGVFGLQGDGAKPFSGIGLDPRVVEGCAGGRFQDAADEEGLIGHRVAWASKALHLVCLHGGNLSMEGGESAAADIIRRHAFRAGAFRRKWDGEVASIMNGGTTGDDGGRREQNVKDVCATVRKGLRWLESLIKKIHGRKPKIIDLIVGHGEAIINEAKELRREMEEARLRLAKERGARLMQEARRWAKSAPIKVAHKVTKRVESSVRNSASASKEHQGERTPQEAANAGRAEWGKLWLAKEEDGAEEIIKAIEALYEVGRIEEEMKEIQLPPLDGERLAKVAATFKAGTGLGVDHLRPRHIVYLSKGARKALAELLQCLEKHRRWPSTLRTVVEIALGKKSGGSRLVGLSSTLYRVWAKARYADCRKIIEGRLARPYLAAAPGNGAIKAIVDQAWEAELATARNEVCATTLVDFERYYEYIDMAELAEGSMQFGIPREIVAMAVHLYLGPRHISVGKMVARATYPRRSVLARCTWATLFVRAIVIKPVDNLMKMIQQRLTGWEATINISIFIDDGAVTTRGTMGAVEYLHCWITRLVLQWVRVVLRKKVAESKLCCIAGDKHLRKTLKEKLAGEKCAVVDAGEILGADYAAGGNLHKRRVQTRRRKKAMARKGRLQWWRKLGGNATEVSRGGCLPEMSYGCQPIGIPPRLRRAMRRAQASGTKVRCGGSSLTARLALAGPKGEDLDPAVTLCNPALEVVTARVWDDKRSRSQLVKMWLRARDELKDEPMKRRWAKINGPVRAAMAQLWEMGAEWTRPFYVTLLDHEIPILEIPPLQVMAIARAHARRHLDRVMLDELCATRGWDQTTVMNVYKHGIAWDTLRKLTHEAGSELTRPEKAALRLVACNGYWSEERRWLAGYKGHGSCEICCWELGTLKHSWYDCDGVVAALAMQRAGGRLTDRLEGPDDAGLAPLVELALPPKSHGWEPIEAEHREGGLEMGSSRESYGDGSGLRQANRELRLATWSVVRLTEGGGGGGGWHEAEMLRGSVGGWFPTVPRAEMKAYEEHLVHCGPEAIYGGDCKLVVEAANNGVPMKWTSSANLNADRWANIRRLQSDHEGRTPAVKIAAHKSRTAAVERGVEEERRWVGNDKADQAARALVRYIGKNDSREALESRANAHAEAYLKRIAFASAWSLRQRPEAGRQRRTKTRGDAAQASDHEHDIEERRLGGWECRRCKGFALSCTGLRLLRKRACREVMEEQIHGSHMMEITRGIRWCTRCGAYTSRLPRELKKACRGRPQSEAQANVRRRLAMGLAPTTAAYLEEAAADADHHHHRLHHDAPHHPHRPSQQEGSGRKNPQEDDMRGRAKEQRGDRGRGSERARSAPCGLYLRLPGGPLAVRRTEPGEPSGGAGGHAQGSSEGSDGSKEPRSTSGGTTRNEEAVQERITAPGHELRAESATRHNGIGAAANDSSNGEGEHEHHEVRRARRQQSGEALHGCVELAKGDMSESAMSNANQLCHPTSRAPWTRRTWCLATAGPLGCQRCAASTKLRCRGCNRAICLSCARARAPCDSEEEVIKG